MEHETTGDTPAGIDRRSLLKRGAVVGGALVWTTPIVQTIAQPAFAAGSVVIIGCPPGTTVRRAIKFNFCSDGPFPCAGSRTDVPKTDNNGTCFETSTADPGIEEAPSSSVVSVSQTAKNVVRITLAAGVTLLSGSAGVKAGNQCYTATITAVVGQPNTFDITIPADVSAISNVLFDLNIVCPPA